jgi:hypothetical protein
MPLSTARRKGQITVHAEPTVGFAAVKVLMASRRVLLTAYT